MNAASDVSSAIVGLEQAAIAQYFATLNAGEFEATAALFAEDGVLQPPFEKEIAGHVAIAAYLRQEATGFYLQPTQGRVETQEDGTIAATIGGSVRAPLFTVNVSWQFILNAEGAIEFVRVKLLASLQELFKLRSPDADSAS